MGTLVQESLLLYSISSLLAIFLLNLKKKNFNEVVTLYNVFLVESYPFNKLLIGFTSAGTPSNQL